MSLTKRTKHGWTMEADATKLTLHKGNIEMTFNIIIHTPQGMLYAARMKRTQPPTTPLKPETRAIEPNVGVGKGASPVVHTKSKAKAETKHVKTKTKAKTKHSKTPTAREVQHGSHAEVCSKADMKNGTKADSATNDITKPKPKKPGSRKIKDPDKGTTQTIQHKLKERDNPWTYDPDRWTEVKRKKKKPKQNN